MREISQLLSSLADGVEELLTQQSEEDTNRLRSLEAAAKEVGKSWSRSNLGYHSTIYYEGFQKPPPEAHFSPEWGLIENWGPGTTGSWRDFDFDGVVAEIWRIAGDPDLSHAKEFAKVCGESFLAGRSRFASIISRCIPDTYLESLKRDLDETLVFTEADGAKAMLPTGSIMTRDNLALSGGLQLAPHQTVLAQIVALRSPLSASSELVRIARLAAEHLDLDDLNGRNGQNSMPPKRVFLGHGRSLQWLLLKDFIQDSLHLSWDEFNRQPPAGYTTTERLSQMLQSSTFAFLVMTAEDQTAEGELRARENVVHEAGLFQGRLGFSRAILLVEEGCGEFSNIKGLTHIPFPKGNIAASFEEIRRVLKREGHLDG